MVYYKQKCKIFKNLFAPHCLFWKGFWKQKEEEECTWYIYLFFNKLFFLASSHY